MISDRNPPPSNRQLLILLGIFVSGIVIAISLAFLGVNWIITKIPLSWEHKLGSVIVPIYEEKAMKDSPQKDILNNLLDRLESHLGSELKQKRDYRVIYIPEKTVNAFAIPGDVIGIFEGLIEEVNSENELMMILGHELGHFAHRDHLRRLGTSLVIRVAIASIFGNNTTFINPANVIEIITNTRYSQSQEYRADEFGLRLLNQTYGHVAGATDFFQNLNQRKILNWDFFSSHPTSEKRVKKLEKLIQKNQYKVGQYSPLNPTLKLDNLQD